MRAFTWPLGLWVAWIAVAGAADPEQVMREAERLAWLRAWNAAEPHFVEAQKLFAAEGDERNALYAEVSAFRGRLPRMSVPAASKRLAEYLENPLVQTDDRIRLRVLVIKGETDEDLDPTLAAQSWREALTIADKLGDGGWTNRARGELGLLAFLQGDVSGGVIAMGQAVKIAESTGDVSSLVRWVTLFGHGYVQLGRPEEALAYYDRALAAASSVPEIQFPVMTHVGRSNALIRMGKLEEAATILAKASDSAERSKALGYQAQLLSQRALIASQQRQTSQALALFQDAMERARRAGANRLVADIALDAARMQREQGDLPSASATLNEGITAARQMEERFLLPRLLGSMADIEASQRHFVRAAEYLNEASDILRGLFTATSSPWVQSRLVSGMNDVFLARIRLEAARGRNPARMYSAIEEARSRALIELLANRPLASQQRPAELREGERTISDLQRRLFRTRDQAARRQLLAQIFAAEERLAPAATAFFESSRGRAARTPPRLARLQAALRADELLLEFALSNPASYVLVITRESARVGSLQSADDILTGVESLMKGVGSVEPRSANAGQLGKSLLSSIPELATHKRLLISPDGALHNVPFELLIPGNGRSLIDTHIVSYVPSGEVLATIRRNASSAPTGRALAVSASFADTQLPPAVKGVARDAFDLDPSKLRPLPSADDEARSVGSLLEPDSSTVLIGQAATEDAVKRQPLAEYRVLHLAAHGIPSSRFPARAGLLLHPGGTDDGMLQAREILLLPLKATLVTLSACDTGSGSVHGQDGPASLVRPFLAAGARAVVANLWAADDAFSLALMREFYRRLAAGTDVAEALRDAKRHLIATFGPQATPNLWSGVVVYGDGRGIIAPARPAAPRR